MSWHKFYVSVHFQNTMSQFKAQTMFREFLRNHWNGAIGTVGFAPKRKRRKNAKRGLCQKTT